MRSRQPGGRTVSPSWTSTTASARGALRATARRARASASRLPVGLPRTRISRTRAGGASRRNRSLASRWSAISTTAATIVTGLGVACRLLDRGGERGQRGLGRDPVAGDDDEHLAGEQLARGLRFGQRLRLGAPAREHAPPIPERAAQMQRTPAPAPDADPAQDEDEGPGAGAPQARRRVDGEGRESQEVEAEEQGSPSRVARRGCRGVRVGWLSLAVHSRGRQ